MTYLARFWVWGGGGGHLLAAGIDSLEHEESLRLVRVLFKIHSELHLEGVLDGGGGLVLVEQDGTMVTALEAALVRSNVADVVARCFALVIVCKRWRADVAEWNSVD